MEPETRRWSILHILAPAPFGGLEQVVRGLARGQRETGHDVHVAAIVEAGELVHPFVESVTADGVGVVPVVLAPRAYIEERRRLAALMRELGPSVVHTHGYRPDVQAGAVAGGMGLPTVTTVHGFTGGGVRNRLYEWLQLRAFRRFDAVVAVSRPLGERLVAAGVPHRRLHVIPNAYESPMLPAGRETARAALGVPIEGYRLGWVGRLSHEKGADVLIDALRLLRDLPIGLSILGTGRESAALRARAQSIGVSDRIRWHGTVPDAGRLFSAFDCFVLSSRTEGTPIVLFEAMAAEVPIVTTAVGGVPDVVSAGEALLVAPGDPAALAGAIRSGCTDSAAAAARARAARQRLDADFGVAQWLARYDATYDAVVRTPSRAAV